MTLTQFISKLARLARRFAIPAVVLLATVLVEAKPAADSKASLPTQFFVFEGAEVLATHDGHSRRVVGVDRTALVLQAKPESEIVPVRKVQNYLTKREAKFSSFWASIDKVRVTTRRVAYDREMAELELGAATSIRRQEAELEIEKGNFAIGQAALGPRAVDATREQKIADESDRIEKLRNVTDEYSKDRAADLERDGESRSGGASSAAQNLPFDFEYDPLADGIQIKCAISAPEPLEGAFLTVTYRYLHASQPRKKAEGFQLVPVGNIGQKAKKLTIQIRNLPQGFQLVECFIGLYGNGEEVCTNLSPKQETLGEEQVYSHLLDDYLARNRSSTRPPQFMLLARPGALQRGLDLSELEQGIRAEIDKNGVVVSLKADGPDAVELSPQVRSALRLVRFFPALENGMPVDSEVSFTLSDLLEQPGRLGEVGPQEAI